MKTVKAYCPAALSFIFKSCPHKDVLRSGSIGIGCTVDKGVIATVSKADTTQILFNQQEIVFPTVLTALTKLTHKTCAIQFFSPLPLGCGFGLSGACTLTSLYATNKLLGLGKKEEELALIAHQSEIKNRTGLGTVATEITGGFLIKNAPGIPVDATSIPFVGQKLYVVIIDQMNTPTILKDTSCMKKINREAGKMLTRIKNMNPLSLANVLDCSYSFAQKTSLLVLSGLDKQAKEIRQQGIAATLAMLGKVIICDKRPRLANVRIEELTITKDTVRLYA